MRVLGGEIMSVVMKSEGRCYEEPSKTFRKVILKKKVIFSKYMRIYARRIEREKNKGMKGDTFTYNRKKKV
jgi:hypothetical protein